MSNTDLTDPPPQTATSVLFAQLRRDIVQCRLLPGEKLRIEVLRDRYGVGSSPIREALNRLSSEGLVVLQDQKGFRVAEVSLEDLHELTRTRCLINEITLREAIMNGDDPWEEGIVLAYHRLERAVKRQEESGRVDDEEWDERHRIFHNSLISTCGSKWLRNFSMTLFDYAARYRRLSQTAVPRNRTEEHRVIMEAVINRDIPNAVRLLNEHALLTTKIVSEINSNIASMNGREPAPRARAAAS
jgi:GntR family carbon starvation induced transcriptional regulator